MHCVNLSKLSLADCTAEFQLIANVFAYSANLENGGNAMFDLTSLSDVIPFQVARALLQRPPGPLCTPIKKL